MKRTKTHRGGSRGPGPPPHHFFDMVFKHDRKEVNTSHYSSDIFRTNVTKVLYIQQTKNQSLTFLSISTEFLIKVTSIDIVW